VTRIVPIRRALLLLLQFVTAYAAHALDIQIGTRAATPGSTAHVPVTLADAPPNLSAFRFHITNSPLLALPTVQAGPAQPNLQSFVDDLGNGVYRVTGFVLDAPAIGNGVVATLSFALSPATPFGIYPENFLAGPATNPEARALITSALIPSTGLGGAVQVTVQPQFTHFEVHTNGTAQFHFEFNGTPGVTYTVQGSTDLVTWTDLGPATASVPGGVASFLDADFLLHPYRFYRAVAP